MATTLFAQQPGPGSGRRQNPLNRIKDALGLTDAQVQSIVSLAQAEKPRMQAIMTDIQQKRQTLNALLNTASPNPTDVGNAAIALHAAEAKIGPEQTAFLNQVKGQLTGDQQQKLDTLLSANGGRGFPLPGLGGPGFGGPGPGGFGGPRPGFRGGPGR